MSAHYAIMFADVAGSSQLYEKLGNEQAEKCIAACLQRVIEITDGHHGRMIKTLGDEVMCCFPSANEAVYSALDLQNNIGDDSSDTSLALRIGLDCGDVIEKDNDLYGDAVNVAARMTSIAKAKQIITTESVIKELKEELFSRARLFDSTKIKGKENEQKIYQINWEDSTKITQFITMNQTQQFMASSVVIELKYSGEERLIADKEMQSAMSIGRDDCDFIVKSNCASRSHADLDFRRGKFVLIDHSTNGSYVRFLGQAKDMFIRREELPLMGEGIISLGEPIDNTNVAVISFKIRQSKETEPEEK